MWKESVVKSKRENASREIPFNSCDRQSVKSKAPYTLSVKLNDFIVLRHTWRKNWVNFADLTGNSGRPQNCLSSRLSHRELCSSLRESHGFLSLPADTTMVSSQGTQQNWQKSYKPDGKPVLCQRTFSSDFLAVFYTVKLHSLTSSLWGLLG
jgi:hypothetical protein